MLSMLLKGFYFLGVRFYWAVSLLPPDSPTCETRPALFFDSEWPDCADSLSSQIPRFIPGGRILLWCTTLLSLGSPLRPASSSSCCIWSFVLPGCMIYMHTHDHTCARSKSLKIHKGFAGEFPGK